MFGPEPSCAANTGSLTATANVRDQALVIVALFGVTQSKRLAPMLEEVAQHVQSASSGRNERATYVTTLQGIQASSVFAGTPTMMQPYAEMLGALAASAQVIALQRKTPARP